MKMCMSVYGIDLLQNNLSMVQNSKNLCIYKRKYKDKLLDKINIKNKVIYLILYLLAWYNRRFCINMVTMNDYFILIL